MTESVIDKHNVFDAERKVQKSTSLNLELLMESYSKPSEFANCFPILLIALEWAGHIRQVYEALPHFSDVLDITALRNAMVELNFSSSALNIKLNEVDERLFPCLYVPENAPAMVILGKDQEQYMVFNGVENKYAHLSEPQLNGVAYFFKHIAKKTNVEKRGSWFRENMERFKGLIYQMLMIGLFLNIFVMSIPIFIMMVYDKVVASGSTPMLTNFTIGVILAMFGSMLLQSVRTNILAYIGARMDHIIGKVIFERLLILAPSYTESAALGAQISRIKDFDNVRDFFTSPLFAIFFELPFVFLFLGVVWYLGGSLVFVPIAMTAFLMVVTVLLEPVIQKNVAKTAELVAERQSFQLETLTHLSTIKHCACELKWYERYKAYSAKSTHNSFRTTFITTCADAVSDMVMTLSGLAVMYFGVSKVINDEMTVGALIAVMMLIWRVIAPVKKFFSSLTKLSQISTSIKQINALMKIKPEREFGKLVMPLERLKGKIEFNRVSFRYKPNLPPALIGVSFSIEPGEVVCVVGRNGSGKSTLLKLIPQMYIPQAGAVLIDNLDIRQLDPIELRHVISYLPQNASYFYGTVEQNIRFANPVATVHDIIVACRLAGVFDDIMNFPDKFQTRLTEEWLANMSPNFLQGLGLARTYLRNSGLLLFDEPGSALKFDADQQFMRVIDSYRGKSTVVIVTHRPGHLRMADKIIFLEQGHLVMCGSPDEVLPNIPKDFI